MYVIVYSNHTHYDGTEAVDSSVHYTSFVTPSDGSAGGSALPDESNMEAALDLEEAKQRVQDAVKVESASKDRCATKSNPFKTEVT